MISWLRRFQVTTRIMSLVIFLIVVMAAELAFLLEEMQQLKQGSRQQQQSISEQNHWLEKQSAQIDRQASTMQLQLQAQHIQKTFSDMIFWYFDGTVSQYYESLNKAEAAADKLKNQLTALTSDPETQKTTRNILTDLTNYRELMGNAWTYSQQGKDNLASLEVTEANTLANTINGQLLTLTDLFQNRLQEASSSVLNSLDQTLKVSAVVASISSASDERISGTQTRTLLMLLASVPVAIVVALFIILSITRPLKVLQQQLLSIEEHSDLTRTLSVDGRDEIQEISAATQKLLTKLRTTLDDVGAMSTELQKTAENGYQISVRTHEQSVQQQQQSEGIAASATELGASAEDISRTTGHSLNLVNDVSVAAEASQKDVQNTSTTIQQLAHQFDTVDTTVNELVEHSTAISGVLDVIRGIAGKTNLLALNAAIEAARAGEQGRGFAVVADEVRTLAQHTNNSTNEIQNMVEALQKSSTVVMSSLEQNRTQVDAGVKLSKQAENSLIAILDKLKALSEMNQSIAVITGEQQRAALGVDENVQTVHQLASNVESHAADSRQINQTLSTMAETLRQHLSEFQH
ncbi:methyl-accepting chemotaxis protein [Amphritea sp.]|uniref:methyl-accepting chemotaxis protein n=1 Tax=Amphritea sp. TaxID=1872502 RepID=UPI0035674815